MGWYAHSISTYNLLQLLNACLVPKLRSHRYTQVVGAATGPRTAHNCSRPVTAPTTFISRFHLCPRVHRLHSGVIPAHKKTAHPRRNKRLFQVIRDPEPLLNADYAFMRGI